MRRVLKLVSIILLLDLAQPILQGLHVDDIAAKNGLDSQRLGRAIIHH